MVAFRAILEDCQLFDLGFSSVWYTWQRGNFLTINIKEHLDRGLANASWRETFFDATVHHLTHFFSNHFPLLVQLVKEPEKILPKWFRFEAWWILKESFETDVTNLWSFDCEDLLTKLENLKKALMW